MSSLFGALDAAVGGMNAQATALGNISDNVANSQTVGFKGTETAFVDYLTQSSATSHSPGAVVALPQYTNTTQGAISQVSNPTSLAVSGNGYFPVQLPTGTSSFSPLQYYTRAGDFTANAAGYLVNSDGYALDAWPATNAAGTTFNSNALGPVKISTAPSAPVATANITLSANLPTTPSTDTVTTPYASTVQVNDASGTAQNVTTSWSQIGSVTANGPISAANPAIANKWSLSVTSGSTTTGPMVVTFGATPATAGTITSITGPASAVPTAQVAGDAATVTLAENYGLGAQPISLNLGNFGGTGGVTQFAGTAYAVTAQSQDGATQGNYQSTTINSAGKIIVGYDNGTNVTVGQIPLANFNSADSLQQQTGQAFTATIASGNANIVTAGTGGTGTMVVGAVEGSNVNIATEFTNMIVAQRAYTANSKIVTTANQMMQDTLNMVQG